MFTLHILDDLHFKSVGLPKDSSSIWVSKEAYDSIVGDSSDRGAQYVSVVCATPLKQFEIYVKMDHLHPDSDAAKEEAYIREALFPSSILIDGSADVTITLLSIDELPVASSVTVALKEKEVVTWDEDTIRFSCGTVRNGGVLYRGQQIVLRNETKNTTIGSVTDIFPEVESGNAVYVPNKRTEVNFEGLPKVRQSVIDFSKIGGLDELIKNLREIIQIPILHPELLDRYNIRPPRGMILYGPPGNGKTLVARSLAYSLGAKFVTIQGPELSSPFVGKAEEALTRKFKEAQSYPNSVLFIDELDSVASNREKTNAEHVISIVSTLLTLMDGIRNAGNVFVIGATNRLDAIDPALRRPGRFELEYLVPIPSQSARKDILEKTLSLDVTANYGTLPDNFVEQLSFLTNGYSGADLASLYRQAVMSAVRRNTAIDSETGKIALNASIDQIRVEEGDFYEGMRRIVPTSKRGYEAPNRDVSWERYVDLYGNKEKITDLKDILEKPSGAIDRDWEHANLILSGCRGSGKLTFVTAFCKEFRYELVMLDLASKIFYEPLEVVKEIEDALKVAKESSPSLFYLRNLMLYPKYEGILEFLFSELEYFSSNDKVFVCVETKDADEAFQLRGYKRFKTLLLFSNHGKLDLFYNESLVAQTPQCNGDYDFNSLPDHLSENLKGNAPIGEAILYLKNLKRGL